MRTLHGRHRVEAVVAVRCALALSEPELFTTYTTSHRTPDQYEARLADILCRTLLH
ncbi:MAG TPA: hypothetical protein VFP09_01250 [Desertimonas sp.]|nr:hypothetical protein [Desertimonas sp.]